MPSGTLSSPSRFHADESHEEEEDTYINSGSMRDTDFLQQAINDLDDLHADIRVRTHRLVYRRQTAEDCMSQYVKMYIDRAELEELWRNIATAICMLRDAGDLLISQGMPLAPEIKGFVALSPPERSSNRGAVVDQSGMLDGLLERNPHRSMTTITLALTVIQSTTRMFKISS